MLSLVDCNNREDDHFIGGHEDKRAWIRWLIVAILTVPILLGYGIVLGYYFTVVKRNQSGQRSPTQDEIDQWRNEQQNR